MVLALGGCGEIGAPGKPDITAAKGPDGDKATVFVANAGDGSIVTFDPSPNAKGNVLPLVPEGNISPSRRFPQTIDEPTGVFLDKATDTLYVADANGNAILIYENANTVKPAIGSSSPTRIITGRNTMLDHPYDVAFDTGKNQLYVANRDGFSVLRFQVNCPNGTPAVNPLDGNIAPCGVLKGVETQIFFPRGIAVDTTENVLYISNVGDDSILIYDNADTAGGPPEICFSVAHAPPINAGLCNKVPNRVISPHSEPTSDASELESILDIPFGLFIDEINDRLYVVNTGFNLPGILIYDDIFLRKLSGRVIPDRVWISSNISLPPECSPLPKPSPQLPFPPQCNNSQLSLPVGIDVDVPNNLMYIVNNNNTNNINLGTSGNIDSTAILVFDLDVRDAAGNLRCTTAIHICRNIPPLQRLGGDITPDGTSLTNPVGIAVDPVRQVMYLSNPTANNFMTFSLDGNINPFKVNTGNSLDTTNIFTDQTFLERPSGFFYDDTLDRLFIANLSAGLRTGPNGNKQITVFDQIIGKVPVKLTGTLSVTTGGTSIVGVGTVFTQELQTGNVITIGNVLGTVKQINTDLSLELLGTYTGTTIPGPGVSGSIVTGGKHFLNTAPSWSLRDSFNITSPRGVLLDGTRLFVLSTGTKVQLLVYDLSAITGFPTNSITGPMGTTIDLPTPSNIITNGFIAGSDPSAMTLDKGKKLIYVADKGQNRILVYNLDGLTTPPNVITSSEISQPSGLFIDSMNDILYVTNTGNNKVLSFGTASTKMGTILPDRTISTASLSAGDPNLLSAPLAPYVDEKTDRLFLINAGKNAIFIYHNASTRDVNTPPDGANVLPNQRIMKKGGTTPDNTRLNFSSNISTAALLFHGRGNTGTLFVGQAIGSPNSTVCGPQCPRGSLLLFGMEQKVAPSHIFSGGDSVLKAPSAVAFDIQRDILYVSDQGDRANVTGGNDTITIIAGASTLDGNAVLTSFVQANISATLNNPSGLFLDKIPNKLYIANSGGTTMLAGVLSVHVDSTVVTGTGTSFLTGLNPLKAGDILTIKSKSATVTKTVAEIKDNLTLTLLTRWTAPTDPLATAFVSRCSGATPCNIQVYDNADQLDQGSPTPSQTISNAALDRPHGLTVGPGGRAYVANTGGDSILIFDQAGTLIATLDGVISRISRPVDVILDSTHQFLYVLNRLKQEILAFDLDSINTKILNPSNIISPARVIFPTNTAEVLSIDSDTQMTLKADYTGDTVTGMSFALREALFSETFSVPFHLGKVSATDVKDSTTLTRIITGTGTKFIGDRISFVDVDASGNPINKFMNRQERLVDCLSSSPPKNVPCLTIQIDHNMLLKPTSLFLDVSNDIMYVTDQASHSVYIFTNASQRNGNVEIRTIGGNNTGLRQPIAITVNPKTP